MRFRTLFLTFVAILPAAIGSSQSLKPGEWRTYTSMRSVTDVAVSSDSAHVWVATGGGAFEADLRVRQPQLVALRTTNGLFENDLTAVAADRNGNVYFGGSTGGFDVYHAATDSVQQLGADIQTASDPDKTIHAITISGDKIYLATGYGISIYLPQQGVFGATVRSIAGLPFEDSVRQAIDDGSFIYGAMREGVVFAPLTSDLQNGHNWDLIRDTAGAVRALARFKGTILVGAQNGLFSISADRSSLVAIPLPNPIDIERMVATSDSLYLLTATGTVFTSGDLLSFNQEPISSEVPSEISAITWTPRAQIIAGTTSAGVAYVVLDSFQTNIFPSGPVSNSVYYLDFATANDELYVTNQEAGFGTFQPSSDAWQDFESGVGAVPYTRYLKVLYDSTRDLVWLSTYGVGVYKVAGLESSSPVWTNISSPQIPSFTGTYCVTSGMILDQNKNFVVTSWAGNGKGLSVSSDAQNFINYTLGPPSAKSWGCVTQDFNGNYWVGTEEQSIVAGVYWVRASDGGFGEIPGGSGGSLGTPVEGTQIVNAILTDQDDGIWCGTEGGVEIISNPDAILQSDNPQFSIRSVPFLAGQVVRAMTVDGVGNKWIGTDNGIFVVSPDGSDSIARFTKENSPLVDDKITSIAIDPNRGEAYAATASGISRFSTIFKQGKPDYSGIRVYPNPVVQTAEESPTVYIDGLVAGSTVQIFSLSGRLIATINGQQLGSTVTWNGRDALGRQVPSGMYLVSASSPQSGENGEAKVVIVRKPSN